MSAIQMKQLLEAGVHFGHQTKRWNPKMKPFIFGARNGIYIIDLQKTVGLFEEAYQFVSDTVAEGGSVLFVGTKKQAQDSIAEEASRAEQFYVNQRWLGGTLTNWKTIRQGVERLHTLERMEEDGTLEQRPKGALALRRERAKLEKNLSGISKMTKLPDAIFIVDVRKERIALKEANKLKIPVVAVVDTNCDPEGWTTSFPEMTTPYAPSGFSRRRWRTHASKGSQGRKNRAPTNSRGTGRNKAGNTAGRTSRSPIGRWGRTGRLGRRRGRGIAAVRQ